MTNTESDMTAPEKTPLFPLGQPVYPGVLMKLRIFEQRYLSLVRESMRTGKPFGVVPIIKGSEVGATPSFFQWGTLVNIVDFDQQPDGLLGITIAGEQRMRTLEHDVQGDGLIVASITNLDPEPADAPGEPEDDLVKLLQDLIAGLKAEEYFPDQQPSLAQLSWRLATLLPLPTGIKMSLLKEDDPQVRLDIIRECLVDLTAEEKSIN